MILLMMNNMKMILKYNASDGVANASNEDQPLCYQELKAKVKIYADSLLWIKITKKHKWGRNGMDSYGWGPSQRRNPRANRYRVDRDFNIKTEAMYNTIIEKTR